MIDLTPRERTVWLGICAGKTARYIGGELGCHLNTVCRTRVSLAGKLGLRVADTPGLIRAAAAAGLLAELPPLKVNREPVNTTAY